MVFVADVHLLLTLSFLVLFDRASERNTESINGDYVPSTGKSSNSSSSSKAAVGFCWSLDWGSMVVEGGLFAVDGGGAADMAGKFSIVRRKGWISGEVVVG